MIDTTLGKSGEDYHQIYSVAFDEKNKKVFVFDRALSKIQVYSEDGTYKRTLPCPDLRLRIFNFDNETLLAYDDHGILSDKYSNQPYLFISKRDGQVISKLNITMNVRHSNTIVKTVVDNTGKNALLPITVTIPPINYSDGQGFVISDLSSDTIFSLNRKRGLVPLLVSRPSVQDENPQKQMLTVMLKTKDFICLRKTPIDLKMTDTNSKVSVTDIMYNFKDGSSCDPLWINNEFTIKDYWEFEAAETTENIGVCLIDTYYLSESSKAGKLQGKLQQVASNLNEEDNPVIMIANFK